MLAKAVSPNPNGSVFLLKQHFIYIKKNYNIELQYNLEYMDIYSTYNDLILPRFTILNTVIL